jgi:hypothetical protein
MGSAAEKLRVFKYPPLELLPHGLNQHTLQIQADLNRAVRTKKPRAQYKILSVGIRPANKSVKKCKIKGMCIRCENIVE